MRPICCSLPTKPRRYSPGSRIPPSGGRSSSGWRDGRRAFSSWCSACAAVRRGHDRRSTRDQRRAPHRATSSRSSFARSLTVNDSSSSGPRYSIDCRASCATTCSAIQEARDHLEELVSAGNVFVVPIADTGVFRYHPLFAELLLTELRTTAPELEAPLRRRAIEWHERHGEWSAAATRRSTSGGVIDAPPEIFKHLVPALFTGHVSTVGRWLAAFDPAEIRSNALLAVTAAWHAMFSNRSAEIERFLAAAERAGYDGPLPDGTVGRGGRSRGRTDDGGWVRRDRHHRQLPHDPRGRRRRRSVAAAVVRVRSRRHAIEQGAVTTLDRCSKSPSSRRGVSWPRTL